MSEAVTVPSLTMMTPMVSEESLATDGRTGRQAGRLAGTHTQHHTTQHNTYTHTHTHTETGLVHVNFFKIDYDFENKTNNNKTHLK